LGGGICWGKTGLKKKKQNNRGKVTREQGGRKKDEQRPDVKKKKKRKVGTKNPPKGKTAMYEKTASVCKPTKGKLKEKTVGGLAGKRSEKPKKKLQKEEYQSIWRDKGSDNK